MLTELLNFDGKNFEIAADAETEHEDKGLKHELRKLIAEQFDDFDLGDGNEDDQDNSSLLSACVQDMHNSSDPNADDIASILDAGKLSLLEGAIQRFGDELSCPSENIVSESNNFASPRYGTYNVMEFSNHPNDECDEINRCNRGPSQLSVEAITHSSVHPSSNRLEEAYLAEQNYKFYTNPVNVPIKDNATINWDLSLPGEVGNALLMSLQDDQKMAATNHPLRLANPSIDEAQSEAPNSMNFPQLLTSWSPSTNQPSSSACCPTNGFSQSSNLRFSSSRTTNGPHTDHFAAHQESTKSQSPDSFDPKPYPSSIPANMTQPEESNFQHLEPDLDRRDLLYEARGHQLKELQDEIDNLKEEVAKQKRLANHRATLAESEKKAIQSKLSLSEDTIKLLQKELSGNQEDLTQLKRKLDDSENSRNKLTEELAALRSTNESLSNQLVELTTGDAVRRVEEREAQLSEALEKRFSSQTEEVRAELKATLKQLDDKENEIVSLRRQLEISKSDASKLQQEHNDAIKQANKRLEEAQLHCQQLASSSLCSEVSNLRQKVVSLETSIKIGDDVNRILQEELQDLRDQVSVYENVLKLDNAIADGNFDLDQFGANTEDDDGDIPLLNKTTEQGSRNSCSPNRCVTFADETCRPTQVRPASAFERRPPNMVGNSEIQNKLFSDEDDDQFKRCRNPGPKNDTSVFPNYEHNLFQSMTRQGILTSTPAAPVAIGHPVMIKLRKELERCLKNYKIKRQQVTKLHETVFSTRCQLHQAKEVAENAEKVADSMKERVVSLERELASIRDSRDSPNSRELLLSGQIERLKTDYGQLEEELKTTRNRLQAALGAEARALEAEKAATERLNASSAERDAAVDRARAVCEAHYAAMRRRLELDFANEKEADSRRAEEKIAMLHQQLSDCERELQRVTKLLQDSQASTQHAVEAALVEAMQEREAERMRFWIEELPQQLEAAKRSWIQETAAATQQIKASRKFTNSTVQTEPSIIRTIDQACGMDENYKALVSIHVQTDHSKPPSYHDWMDLDCQSPPSSSACQPDNANSLNLAKQYPLLYTMLPERTLYYLMTHLLETQTLNLTLVEKELNSYLAKAHRNTINKVWHFIQSEMKRLISDNQLEAIVKLPTEPNQSDLFQSTTPFGSPQPPNPTNLKSDQPMDLQFQCTIKYANSIRPDRLVIHIQEFISNLLRDLIHSIVDLRSSQTDQVQTDKLALQSSNTSTDSYSMTLDQIKGDVLKYVSTCQTRAALTLQQELTHVHRRTCRQFRSELRRALCMHNYSESIDMDGSNSHTSINSNVEKNLLNLMTVLQLIDRVSTTIESKFKSENTAKLQNLSELFRDTQNHPFSTRTPSPDKMVHSPSSLIADSPTGISEFPQPTITSSIHPNQMNSTNQMVRPYITSSPDGELKLGMTGASPNSGPQISPSHKYFNAKLDQVDASQNTISNNISHGKPVSTDSHISASKPIPAPRTARSTSKSGAGHRLCDLNSGLCSNPALSAEYTLGDKQSSPYHNKHVHTELYKLFEQYQRKPDCNNTKE